MGKQRTKNVLDSDTAQPGIKSYFSPNVLNGSALLALAIGLGSLPTAIAWPEHFELGIAPYALAVLVSFCFAVFMFVFFPYVPKMKHPIWTLGVEIAGPFVLWILALWLLMHYLPIGRYARVYALDNTTGPELLISVTEVKSDEGIVYLVVDPANRKRVARIYVDFPPGVHSLTAKLSRDEYEPFELKVERNQSTPIKLNLVEMATKGD